MRLICIIYCYWKNAFYWTIQDTGIASFTCDSFHSIISWLFSSLSEDYKLLESLSIFSSLILQLFIEINVSNNIGILIGKTLFSDFPLTLCFHAITLWGLHNQPNQQNFVVIHVILMDTIYSNTLFPLSLRVFISLRKNFKNSTYWMRKIYIVQVELWVINRSKIIKIANLATFDRLIIHPVWAYSHEYSVRNIRAALPWL